MSNPANINPRIIEALYCEALVLADEVRAAFDLSGRIEQVGASESIGRIALSCEALRTTTRMMHAIAWLLNHRAYFAGDMTEFQLRRHGRLAADFPLADADRLELISPDIRALIAATERFHARLVRLDRGWREAELAPPGAVGRLRNRLGRSLAG